MQPAKERIQGYLDTLSTYGVDSENCYWTPTTEAFKELCELALKGLAVRPEEKDTARLDALERDVAENGPLLIHNEGPTSRQRGLGLACTGRSLRKAIDDMTYANESSVVSPQKTIGRDNPAMPTKSGAEDQGGGGRL